MDADVDPSTIVQIIPGTGWVLEYLNEDGQLDVSPLLAGACRAAETSSRSTSTSVGSSTSPI